MKKILLYLPVMLILAAGFGCSEQRKWNREQRKEMREMLRDYRQMAYLNDMDSPILKAMTASYEALYGSRPSVMAIHAGLECGVIGGTYPKLDMISFGPTICYPHSPDERVEIASVGKFYEFLLHTLKHIPVR